MPPYSLAEPEVFAFVALPILVSLALLWGTVVAWRRAGHAPSARRAAALTGLAAGAWMALTHAVAASGVLREWNRTPPPFFLLVLGIVAIAVAIAVSRLGARLSRLPLWALVGVQAFRGPLELAMHRLAVRGIMPEQMSYTGRNLDIVTGTSAVLVAILVGAGIGGRWLVAVWNVMGLILLTNIVAVAILSTPRFRFFGDDRLNVFITYPPFEWLPAVLVLAALAGHLLIFRALATGSAGRPGR